MIKKIHATMLAFATCITGSAIAQDWRSAIIECGGKGPDSEIAACIKQANEKLLLEEEIEKKKAVEEATKKQEEERIAAGKPKIVIRDDVDSVADISGLSVGKNGATFSSQRKDGQDSSIIKAGIFVVTPAFDQLGKFQPFFGVAWQRDTSGKEKSDLKDFTAGGVGYVIPVSSIDSFSALYTVQMTHRKDIYSDGDENFARAHFDLLFPGLANGRMLGGLSVIPNVAVMWSDHNGGGAEAGIWRSTYIGIDASKPIEVGAHRLKVSGQVKKLFDYSVPGGNVERRDKYASLAIDWYFYDPQNKKAIFQPSLFLQRETGSDFINGAKRANRTLAGLRFKLN